MSTEKLAVTLMVSAIHKRTIAETLWAEAEKDMAQAKAILSEIWEEVDLDAEVNAD